MHENIFFIKPITESLKVHDETFYNACVNLTKISTFVKSSQRSLRGIQVPGITFRSNDHKNNIIWNYESIEERDKEYGKILKMIF